MCLLSAVAQIAAMEAKLASMAKRKPADEDYVPGQGTYSGSGTTSPMPDVVEDGVEIGPEDEQGQMEGEMAAGDLEMEIQAELFGFEPVGADEVRSGMPGSSPLLREQEAESATVHLATDTKTLLPPRPATNAKLTVASRRDPESKAREYASAFSLKRGLAGLPKKPAF